MDLTVLFSRRTFFRGGLQSPWIQRGEFAVLDVREIETIQPRGGSVSTAQYEK